MNSSYRTSVDEIHVILNDATTARFKEAEQKLHNTLRGLSELKDEDQSPLGQQYLGHLLSSPNVLGSRNSNPVSAWHGVNSKNLESICWYGLLNLRTSDPGYYGKAIYLTQEPNYGSYYAETIKDKGKGQFCLVLCWALIGKPYAVTKVHLGKPLEPGYTSHYTLVSKKQAAKELCQTSDDFELVRGMTDYFPILPGDTTVQDEIALFEPSYVLPQYVVKYSVEELATPVFTPVPPPTTSYHNVCLTQ